MKNKNQENLDRPVVLRDFKEFTEISKQDFKEFTEISEKRFKEFTDRAFSTFATKEDIAHLPTKKDLKEYQERLSNDNDKIAGELSTVRQEQSADTLGNIRRDDKIEELDNRIVHVETKLAISPAGS